MRTRSSKTFLLDPLPEELLYSSIARSHALLGWKDKSITLNELFRNPKFSPVSVGRLNVIEDFETVCSHIVQPYYMSTWDLTRQKKGVEAIFKTPITDKFNNVPKIPHSKRFKKSFLYYCPQCILEDRQTYGMPFFHTVHQLECVQACSKHRTKLLPYSKNQKGPPLLPILTPDDVVETQRATPLEVEFSCWAEEFHGFSHEYLLSKYHFRILELDPNLFDVRNFYNGLLDFFDAKLLEETGTLNCLEERKNVWIKKILDRNCGNAHPFYHFMVQKFLGLNSQDFQTPITVTAGTHIFVPYAEDIRNLDLIKSDAGIEEYYNSSLKCNVYKLLPYKSLTDFL